jgi:glycosyltransferase involved in cell wall biosynthesis
LDTLRANGLECDVEELPGNPLKRWILLRRCADYDGVFLQKKRVSALDGFWLRRNSRKLIYDFDDAVMYSDADPDRPHQGRMRTFRRTAAMADMVIAGNPYLANIAAQYNRSVQVLPTGLALEEFVQPPRDDTDEAIRLVWIGTAGNLKYLEGIQDALEQVGQSHAQLRLRVICNQFPSLQNMTVEEHPWSLDRQADDLCGSDIGLAPLPDERWAQGKCGFKILQYQAAGLPVITAPVGVNASYVEAGQSGYHATTTEEWVRAIVTLAEDVSLRRRMGEAGRKHAAQFDVPQLGAQLSNMIKDCLASRGTGV